MNVLGRTLLSGMLLAVVVVLSGCAGKGGGAEVNPELTWEEAKASTMARAAEIAELIPADQVVSLEQRETGTLFDCGPTLKNWNSSTRVVLVEGADAESLVKAIETHYEGRDFTVTNDINISGNYRVGLVASDGLEGYLISIHPEDELIISYGSTCFTPPEGVYLGGDW
jgi:hypothetical protein